MLKLKLQGLLALLLGAACLAGALSSNLWSFAFDIGAIGTGVFWASAFILLEDAERLDCKAQAELHLAGQEFNDEAPIFTVFDGNGKVVKRKCPGRLVASKTPPGGFYLVRKDLF